LQVHDRLWADFSFVASSGYREKVISSLASKPMLPGQLAEDLKLRLGHVSRALRQLSDRGLVECLTPSARSHGRLYALTKSGAVLVAYRRDSSQRFSLPGHDTKGTGFVPKIRAAVVVRGIQHLKRAKGDAAVRGALKDWSVNLSELMDDMWLSADAVDEFNELLESKFGDGTYQFIRELYTYAVPAISSVREQIIRVIPLEALAERAPIAYNREWNYGRVEVRTGRRRAVFLHFDVNPPPSFCMIFQGAYEGVLRARKVVGTVTKTRCVRRGDDHCEYLVEW